MYNLVPNRGKDKAVICLGCGRNIVEDRVKKVLESSANRHVLPLWSYLFQEVVNENRLSLDVRDMVTRDGRLCKKCFCALQHLSKKVTAVKTSMKKVLLAFGASPQNSESSTTRSIQRSQLIITAQY